ncbi:MAG: hypothetical protein JWP31_161 [Aeromicrobium sp.]|nr:hypothetical protein [Aeromicrobium sp.]
MRAARRPLPLWAFLSLAMVAMTGIRLLFLGEPAGRDEAGYLIVGNGWHDGSSIYGDYWVDRPPLLIGIMQLAGNLTALRLLGLLSTGLMVLGVARAAYVARGDAAARWAAGAAALFGVAHWFGVPRTNGEMLAAAFVAWGFALAVQALIGTGIGTGRRTWPLAVGAGILAGCAGLIKQTIADGVVFALVLAVALAWQRPDLRRHAAAVVGWGAAGLVTTLGLGLAAAVARGTSVGELFDALVTFRAAAGEVIRTSASDATTDRLWVLLGTWLVSGLAVIAVLALWNGWRRREPVTLAALGVIVFVSGAAILGGSYWGHYLFQLVPASALAVGLIHDQVRPRIRIIVPALVAAATLGNLGWTLVSPPADGVEAEVVGTWLRQSGRPSDSVVVAYGQPNVLASAEMSSPYPYLWSLPVRTLDPDLVEMSSVLAGADRPAWFIDWSGVESWGIDSARVKIELGRHYRQVTEICGRTVWLANDQRRSFATPQECP